MDIILITDFTRPELVWQTIETLRDNASYDFHHLYIVVTGRVIYDAIPFYPSAHHTIVALQPGWCGVGVSKNYGATLGKDDILMFSDDDIYYMRGWDERLMAALDVVTLVGACSHPFNVISPSYVDIGKVAAVSGNCCAIRRRDWDRYGPYDPTTEPAMSEDVKLSRGIVAGGGTLGVTLPFCAIHCGLTNCRGKPIVGRDALESFNIGFMQGNYLEGVVMK